MPTTPEYEAVIDLYPKTASVSDTVNAYGNLGWCKFLTGSIDEVIPLEEKATRFDPGDLFAGLRKAGMPEE